MAKEVRELRVAVDRSRCCGYTLCAEICPEVFKLDAGGFAYVADEPVPAAHLRAAQEAAEQCPELAIIVVGCRVDGLHKI